MAFLKFPQPNFDKQRHIFIETAMYAGNAAVYSCNIHKKGEQMQYQSVTSDIQTNDQTNTVTLTGTVTTEPTQDNQFYLSVPRLSGMADSIPIVMSEELANTGPDLVKGQLVRISGQFQSYNKIVGDRSKLMLTVCAQRISAVTSDLGRTQGPPLHTSHLSPTEDNPNQINITGYICKAPIYRTTPFNREIADLLIAVNRTPTKSDYLPAIAWGRNARFSKNLLVGEKVSISGRIQSREYQKRFDDGTIETRTAFEVSINSIERAP